MNSRLMQLLAVGLILVQGFIAQLEAMPNAMPQAGAQPADSIMPAAVMPQPLEQKPLPLPQSNGMPAGQAQPLNQPITNNALPSNNALSELRLKDFENALKGMEQEKQDLTKLLQDLDEKLLEARKQAAEAKTVSYALLDKKQETDAQSDFEKIRAANTLVKATQDFVLNEFNKNFNEKISQLRIRANDAETAIKELHAAKNTTPAIPQVNTNTTASTNPAAIDQKSKTIGTLDSVTSGIAYAVNGIKNFFGDGDEDIKKKTIHAVQSNEPIPTNQADLERQSTAMIAQIDQDLHSIDALRNTIEENLTTMKKSTTYIEDLAKTHTDSAVILAKIQKRNATLNKARWKRVTLHMVSKTLDGIGYIATGVYSLFDATLGSFTRKIIKDVSAKIKNTASSKATSAGA